MLLSQSLRIPQNICVLVFLIYDKMITLQLTAHCACKFIGFEIVLSNHFFKYSLRYYRKIYNNNKQTGYISRIYFANRKWGQRS